MCLICTFILLGFIDLLTSRSLPHSYETDMMEIWGICFDTSSWLNSRSRQRKISLQWWFRWAQWLHELLTCCRSVPLSYERDVEVRGIVGHKFTTRLQEVDADNSCDCKGICEPSGLVNLTACRYGDPPVFVSLPHFYRARPLYLEKLEGLRPMKEKHEFFATIEPVSSLKSGIQLYLK